ncbi:hypothetical protein ABTX81_01255 [Kitasatospora sp. NPDC097605]
MSTTPTHLRPPAPAPPPPGPPEPARVLAIAVTVGGGLAVLPVRRVR